MSEVINSKKITMDVTSIQHRRVRDAAKQMSVTQQELLGIIIDLTLTNIDGIRPHVAKYVQRRDAEVLKQKELQQRAERLIALLSPDKLERLLTGELKL